MGRHFRRRIKHRSSIHIVGASPCGKAGRGEKLALRPQRQARGNQIAERVTHCFGGLPRIRACATRLICAKGDKYVHFFSFSPMTAYIV